MRYVLSATIVILLATIATAAVLLADEGSADTTYEVDGKVVNFDGTPLGGVNVFIYENGDETDGKTATTDSNGVFKIDELTSTTDLMIRFYSGGRTVTAIPSIMTSASGEYRLNLSSVVPVDDVYDITSAPVSMMETRLSGYIMDETSNGNIPLKNTKVVVGAADPVLTDDKGAFTIPISSTYNLLMSVDAPGYTPVPGVFFITNVIEKGGTVMKFDLNGTVASLGASYRVPFTDKDGVRTYNLPSEFPILMSASTGSITMYVYDNDGTPLRGAEVTFNSTDGSTRKYTGSSDDSGCVTINNMSTGEYDVTIKVSGFKDVIQHESVGRGSNTLPDTVMADKTSEDYWGMPLRHLMTLVGVIAGVLISIILLILVARNKSVIDLES